MNKNKVIEYITIVCLSLSYFMYSSLFTINYYFSIGVGLSLFVLMLCLLITNKNAYVNKKEFRYSAITLLLPEIILILYSFVIVMFNYSSGSIAVEKYISRSLLFVSAMLASIGITGLYKKNAVNIIFKSAVLNYMIYIIVFIKSNGIANLFYYTYLTIIGNEGVKSILEAHEVTFVFGLLFLYYFFTGYNENKKKVIICLVFSLLGFKRIMAIAIILVLVIYYAINKLKKSNFFIKRMNIIITIGLVIFSYFWLYLVKNNSMQSISEDNSINFMGRLGLYELISNEFKLDVFFEGRGLGYISVWGEKYQYITNGTALHSGIIQMYVENGFILFFLYLINKVYFNSRRIMKKTNNKNYIMYLMIILYTIVCWSTDNVATYYNYLIASNIITLVLFNNFNNIKEIKEHDKE